MKPQPEIAVVVPVYGCPDALFALHERISRSLCEMTDNFVIVLVDDRCPRNSWKNISELAQRDPDHVRAVRLSRNFGQHRAIHAGLDVCKADNYVVMDCDLEETPEVIPEMFRELKKAEVDIVYSNRIERKHSLKKRLTSFLYLKFAKALNNDIISHNFGSLSVFNRKVRDAYVRLTDFNKHHLNALYWLGFKWSVIDVPQNNRHSGTSSYTFMRLIRHAIDGIVFQSTVFLSAIVCLGFLLTGLGLLLCIGYLVLFIVATPPPGWTSLILLQLIIGGFIVCCLGITGLYIGAIFRQVSKRPMYVIDQDTGD